jgi:hypothetical protein
MKPFRVYIAAHIEPVEALRATSIPCGILVRCFVSLCSVVSYLRLPSRQYEQVRFLLLRVAGIHICRKRLCANKWDAFILSSCFS